MATLLCRCVPASQSPARTADRLPVLLIHEPWHPYPVAGAMDTRSHERGRSGHPATPLAPCCATPAVHTSSKPADNTTERGTDDQRGGGDHNSNLSTGTTA